HVFTFGYANDLYFDSKNLILQQKSGFNVGIGESLPETLLELTHTTPTITGHCSTHSDAAGSGASKWIGKREDGAGTETAAGQIEISHDGAVINDQLGKMVLSVNIGAGLAEALEIGSDLLATFAGNIVIPDAGYIGPATSPTAMQFAANGEVTFTDVATGILPTTGAHLATKEYVDLTLGTSKTFFLSDTGSGVGTLNYAYPHETGEAQGTIVNDGGGEAYGVGTHLHRGFITEAGEPATTTIHAGIIAIHFHAKKGASNQRITTLHAVISSVDADGTSGKITLATSEVTAELTDSEIKYTIHATMGSDVEVASTARLICDVYANVTTGAQDSIVTLYMEGTEDSYFSTKVDSGIWQNYGDVLDDINTLGQVTADSEILVGTAAGVFAWETGATLRTSI
ncbi:hypothetical protein LCGC14_2841940, partial [marine sediment metagenome]